MRLRFILFYFPLDHRQIRGGRAHGPLKNTLANAAGFG
jgi:hypothetical protein